MQLVITPRTFYSLSDPNHPTKLTYVAKNIGKMTFLPFPCPVVKHGPKSCTLVSHPNTAGELETGIDTHSEQSVQTPGGCNNLSRQQYLLLRPEGNQLCVTTARTPF